MLEHDNWLKDRGRFFTVRPVFTGALKMQGMENARKEIMGKCKGQKMQGYATAAATPSCETALCQNCQRYG